MGQDSTWHLQQLNQYIFDFNSSIEGISSNSSNNSHSISNISDGSISVVQNFYNNRSSLSAAVATAAAAAASSSLSSSTISTTSTSSVANGTLELFTHRQLQNFSNAVAERFSAAIQLALSSDETTIESTITTTATISDGDYNSTIIWSNWLLLLLIILYCIVVLGGIFGNASLIITLYTQSSARLRNPLLVALCLADLMVTGVAAPLTIVTLVIVMRKTITSALVCKSIYFMQSVPVAASTISLLMLSLDRYATVKHPRLAQLRQRRFLPVFLAFASWISAICISVPILMAYNVTPTTLATNSTDHQQSTLTNYTKTIITPPPTITSLLNAATLANNSNSALAHNFSKTFEVPTRQQTTLCRPDFGTTQMHNVFVTIYTLFVFILPGVGVILNHLGVRQKLCALSLTARAAHGELPLPMPIMRRPTHMIIVTGMANAAAVGADDDDSTNDDNNQQKDERRYMMDSTKLKATPRTPRSLRYGHSIRTHSNNPKNVPPSELPLPQTSTLRSRRRLANMLVAGSLVFVFCWSPHVICLICTKLAAADFCSKTVADYSLLLGYTHSALNPILHWALNHNSLRQSSFLLRLTSVQRFLRTHLRERNHQPPPSSTNEAALGPFNPRYIKARPQQYHAPASSHFLY